jgi:hypothetical protein
MVHISKFVPVLAPIIWFQITQQHACHKWPFLLGNFDILHDMAIIYHKRDN